jgi:rhamnosyltransferase
MPPAVPSFPRASAVIPVQDGAGYLRALLPVLREQDLPGGLEIVAVDSSSRDESLSLLEQAGARVVHLAPGEFDHGTARNRGVCAATGEYVLFLSQDALPADASYASRLVSVLESDERLAGAFARQVARPDADPITRRDLASWVAAAPEPRLVFQPGPDAWRTLAPVERYRLAAFDNVASAVRRSVLTAEPFRPSRFGEDVEWGQRMLARGFGLAYVPEAVVQHSHRRSARGLFRRNYLGHRLLFRLFGLRTVPDRPHLVRSSIGALVSDLGTLASAGARPGAWLAAPAQALAATYGQYLGALDEARGRPYPDWAS